MAKANFSKQHYEEIARTLWEVYPSRLSEPSTKGGLSVDVLHDISVARGAKKALWMEIVTRFADVFAEGNPRFDRQRFRRACMGYGQEGERHG